MNEDYPEGEKHKYTFFYYDIAIVKITALAKDIHPLCLPGKNQKSKIRSRNHNCWDGEANQR